MHYCCSPSRPIDVLFFFMTSSSFSFFLWAAALAGGLSSHRLQPQRLFPVSWGGVYVAGGPGGIGGGVSVSGTTIIGGFSGGLVFRLGNGS